MSYAATMPTTWRFVGEWACWATVTEIIYPMAGFTSSGTGTKYFALDLEDDAEEELLQPQVDEQDNIIEKFLAGLAGTGESKQLKRKRKKKASKGLWAKVEQEGQTAGGHDFGSRQGPATGELYSCLALFSDYKHKHKKQEIEEYGQAFWRAFGKGTFLGHRCCSFAFAAGLQYHLLFDDGQQHIPWQEEKGSISSSWLPGFWIRGEK